MDRCRAVHDVVLREHGERELLDRDPTGHRCRQGHVGLVADQLGFESLGGERVRQGESGELDHLVRSVRRPHRQRRRTGLPHGDVERLGADVVQTDAVELLLDPGRHAGVGARAGATDAFGHDVLDPRHLRRRRRDQGAVGVTIWSGHRIGHRISHVPR